MKKEIFWLSIILAICLGVNILPCIGDGTIQTVSAATIYFESGWEDGQDHGIRDRVEYSEEVAGYFNTSNPPPECSPRPGETVRSGNSSLMIAGYSRADYAYCYYRVFDLNLDVVAGMKIGYWIYHSQGSPKIAVDGHFADGNTIRDFGGGILQDQYGVPIHPAHRQDPMNEWHYVEVDLSAAAGKRLASVLFAFDNGGDKFKGQYRTYVDDVRIFKDDPQPNCQANVPETSWKGEYFNNMNLGGSPAMVQNDGEGFLDYDWDQGSPGSSCGIGEDRFSVRWTRRVNFSPGSYEFTVTGDDGVRLWVDDQLKLDQWVDQPPTEYKVGPLYLAGEKTLRMEYYENGWGAVAKLSWQRVDRHCQADVPADHWRGEYFNGMDLSGSPAMVRDDGQEFLNFDWGTGSPESSCGIGIDRFSARWTRALDFTPGMYQFTITVDDGAKFWIDDQLKLEKWIDQPPTNYTVGPILLSGRHTLRMEYYENGGGAVANLSWERVGPPPETFAGTLLLQAGWEENQVPGFKDRLEYSKNVTQAQSQPGSLEMARSGSRSLLFSGVSQGDSAYAYFRILDVEIPVQRGMRIGYWIYHAQGSPKIALDGHFTDGTPFRDFNNSGYLTDQDGVRIHPAHRNDPMLQWHYVEVDLSKAEGKTIDYLMLAFDNGGDWVNGSYRAYLDDLRVFFPTIHSLTQGEPEGSLGSGRQTNDVTEPETWRWAVDFYGHGGMDEFAARTDACGVQHRYAMGFHQNDLIEYLMKFGGEFNRLTLRGLASQPGPIKMEIYIDGLYRTTAAFDANSNCSQDVAINIQGIPYGTHAMAVKFANDYSDPGKGIDRNFFLEGLWVTRWGEVRSRWAYPVGTADSAEGWAMTNALGEDASEYGLYGHLGEDWAKYGDSFGEPVHATASGKVIILRPNCASYLDLVVIEHNVDGFAVPLYSFYGHIEAEGVVKEGDWVQRRQQIGTVGRPERYAPHLHFQIMNRSALVDGPLHYTCTDTSKGWYISPGYSMKSDDYKNQSVNDYYDPTDSIPGNRFYHPRRWINANQQ